MVSNLLSIKEVVEPISGGYWGATTEPGTGNARVVRNGDVLESGEIGEKVPERMLNDNEIRKARLRTGDILITMSGNVGRVARVRNESDINNKPFVASNFVKILRTREDILPAYLFFLLKGSQFQCELKKYTRGVAIQNLSTKIFDQKFIPDISIKEQEEIISLLEEVEALRQKRVAADHNMDNLIPALFNQIFSDTKNKFPVKKLIDLVDSNRPITYGILKPGPDICDGIPYVRVLDIKYSHLHVSQLRKTTKAIAEQYKRSVLHPGDILVTIRGTAGRTCLVPEELAGANITQDTARIAVGSEVINTYIMEFINSDWAQNWISNKLVGQAVKGINLGDLKQLPVPVPPINLQKDFGDMVECIRNIEDKQKTSAMNIEKLFSSLMAKSFN